MTWTSAGLMRSDKVGLGQVCTVANYETARGYYAVGYDYSDSNSFYRVRNNIVEAQIFIPSTTVWQSNPPGEFRLICDKAVMPVPRHNGSSVRTCGTAVSSIFGGYGSDFIMENVYNEHPSWVSFKFLVRHVGSRSVLNENNKDIYIGQFFGTYAGFSISLEYDI